MSMIKIERRDFPSLLGHSWGRNPEEAERLARALGRPVEAFTRWDLMEQVVILDRDGIEVGTNWIVRASFASEEEALAALNAME